MMRRRGGGVPTRRRRIINNKNTTTRVVKILSLATTQASYSSLSGARAEESMEETSINEDLGNLELSSGDVVDPKELAPIPLRKTLVVINNYIGRTTQFLNHFHSFCEEKLQNLSRSLFKVETMLALLESKLNSVEELGPASGGGVSTTTAAAASSTTTKNSGTTGSTSTQQQPSSSSSSSHHQPSSTTTTTTVTTPVTRESLPEPEQPKEPVLLNKDVPAFAPFFKMVKMGVPLQAVKNKMENLHGLDGSVLDYPNQPYNSDGAKSSPSQSAQPEATSNSAAAAETHQATADNGTGSAEEPPAPTTNDASNDPAYTRYFKMVKMGVPLQAVKNKMAVEAPELDPEKLN